MTKPGSDFYMQMVLCPACVRGHCVAVGTGGEIVYCGPLKDAQVTQAASVYLHPDDLEVVRQLAKERVDQ